MTWEGRKEGWEETRWFKSPVGFLCLKSKELFTQKDTHTHTLSLATGRNLFFTFNRNESPLCLQSI